MDALFPVDPTARRIVAQQSRIVHRQVPASLIGGLIILGFFAAVFWSRVDRPELLVWSLMVISMSAARFWSWRGSASTLTDDEAALRWLRVTLGFLLLSALVWGCGMSLFIHFRDPLQAPLIVMFCMALLAGAVVPLSTYSRCYRIYAIPLVIPIVLRLAASGDTVWMLVAMALAFFVAVNARYSLNVEEFTLALIRSEFGNEKLIADLSVQQREAIKQAELADAANRSRARFVAAASHDLAQPMHSMGLFLDSLDHEIGNRGNKTSELVTRARECARNLSEMFSDLLTVSRIESGTVSVVRAPCSAVDALNPVVEEFLPRFESGPVRLDIDIDNAMLDTDAASLRRIVRNLMTNAANHTQSGVIALHVKRAGTRAMIEVRDSGVGIPAAALDDIFSEHFQVSAGHGGNRAGLGLGLSIVRNLADLLDISVGVRSSVGVGSIFELKVPLALSADRDERSTVDVTQAHEQGALLIVVIEDNLQAREALAELLRRDGWDARLYGGGDEALADLSAGARRPDLIISDYDLAGGDNGVDAIDRIREEFNWQIPALVVTGHSSKNLHQRIDELGLPLLPKPFSHDDLTKQIESALGLCGRDY